MQSTIRTIIVDDENNAIETLTLTINKYCKELEVLGSANNINEASELIARVKPDLVFLDINMPGGTGLDLLNQLPEKEFEVIFTTAHSRYAIQAIRLAALDYILKPIDHEELTEAVERFKERQQMEQKPLDLSAIQRILAGNESNSSIGIPTNEGVQFVKMDDIVYCESARNYSVFHLAEGEKIVAARTLGSLEEVLDKEYFFRIHKSYLININHIRKYVRGRGGQVVLDNGQTLEVARNRKDDLIKKMKIF